jgi:hypothetical protein
MAKRKDSRTETTARKQKHPLNGEMLRAAVAWAVNGRIFDDCQLHGNTKWRAADLIVLAVVWVWSGDATLTGAFGEAHRWSLKVLGRSAVGTYQGLIKALVTWTGEMLPRIWCHLQGLMREHGDKHWRVGLWLALAVDGSRVSVPRTKANEKAFCAPNFGKGQTARYRKKKNKGLRATKKDKEKMQPVKPQIWITLVWHMGLQMPWSWKSGASNSSERDHFRQMLQEQNFPENTLFCADAGFTGYDLWKTIIDGGHSFLIRVGANVTLLRKLGYVRERAGLVYFWPDKAARKQQPPLVLRLLHFKLGKCNIYLVTNVLSKKRLTDRQAIEVYQLRWGVELQFRTIKQTFGRRKLRSKTPDRALVELDWSLLGLWMIQLFAVKEQIEIGEVPDQCSVSLAIHVVRTTFQRWSERPDVNEAFATRLQAAIKDDYQRKSSKQARYKPKYKDKPSAGKPIIVTATRRHKSRLIQHLQMAA